MAATFNKKEREKLIKLVGEYFLKTGASTREIAEKFGISNKTAYNYIKQYQTSENEEEINNILYSHKGQAVTDEGVVERVFSVARLIINGYTKKEIANLLSITPKTVEHDISIRLRQICEDDKDLLIYYEVVLRCLKKHQIDPLNECEKSLKYNM